MFLDPHDLKENLQRLEGIEKGTVRLVAQAVFSFSEEAQKIFRHEKDLAGDIGEDITREAMDRVGVSRVDERLFGKIDYKRARYIFNNEYAIKQALFVDSKAEKVSGRDTATIQTSQTSLRIRLIRAGSPVDERGKLPVALETKSSKYLTTTVFVKYNYNVVRERNNLVSIIVAGLPNGMLQEKYNPSPENTIWRTGRDSPLRGEAFRVRLVFALLKEKQRWRVQNIPMPPEEFKWDE